MDEVTLSFIVLVMVLVLSLVFGTISTYIIDKIRKYLKNKKH